MQKYLYLSLLPESLVMSMLPPEEFGLYMAVGMKKRSSEQAIFLGLDEDFSSDYFDLAAARLKCIPHADGSPKHSIYVSIYRALEHVPLKAIKDLYLTTRDGRVLTLKSGPLPQFDSRFHLYQELCPVHPLITSRLNPGDYCRFITDPAQSVSVPRIVFVDLQLGELAKHPVSGDARDLPYSQIDHLRNCLEELISRSKAVKMFDRIYPQRVPYWRIQSGFFVGDQTGVVYFRMPSPLELEEQHHEWWRSATMTVMQG